MNGFGGGSPAGSERRGDTSPGAGKPLGTATPPDPRDRARLACGFLLRGQPRQSRVPSVARTCASQSVPPSAAAAHLGAARAGRRLRDAGGAGRARAP